MQKSGLLVFTLLLILLNQNLAWSQNQPKISSNGGCHTPKGRLHILSVFVRFEDKDLMPENTIWKNSSDPGVLPDMATGNPNGLFDSEPETLTQPGHIRNISDFYYHQSGGKFIITGDIFPVQVPIRHIPETAGNFFERQSKMNLAAINWITENYPDFDWSKYDTRKNHPNYLSDNSQSRPDSILDYVLFFYRDPGTTGMSAIGNIPVKGTPYKINTGHTSIKTFSDAEHNWEYFKHEFAHNLYNCPHYNGANGTVGDKFYMQRGWGLMSATSNPFFVANAWEKWWLGWIEPQNGNIPGIYTLKDFASAHDAIRIQIPGTQDYLWIENHQKKDHWDDKLFFKEPDRHPQSAKGVYLFVTSETGFDRTQPVLSPFNVRHCNMIKVYNGEGNFDYNMTGDTVSGEYFPCPVWKKGRDNPFSGQNDLQGIRFDMNRDNKVEYHPNHGNLDIKAGEQYEVWAENSGGENRYSCSCTGDMLDGFDTGDEIGISGIVPVQNFPVYDEKKEQLAPYILNGISVKILEFDSEGNARIEIKTDDYSIRNSKRWCGNLSIPAKGAGSAQDWTIEKGVTLTLDLSGTPDRSTFHSLTKTYVNPTVLKIDANNHIQIKSGATVIVDKYSKTELTGNAQITVQKGGKLIIREGGELILNPGTKLNVQKGGRFTVESGGNFRQMEGSALLTQKGSKVKL